MPASDHSSHHIIFFFQKNLKGLFWSALLRNTAVSLISVFSLIFIFKVGMGSALLFPMLSVLHRGMLWIVLYVLSIRLVVVFSILPLSRLVPKVGLSTSIILGNIAIAVKYAILIFAKDYPYLIFVAALFHGLEICLYWPAYHTIFATKVSFSKIGRSVSTISVTMKIIHAISPLLSAFLIVSYGFPVIFCIATMLIVLSIFPLLSLTRIKISTVPSLKNCGVWMCSLVKQRVIIAGTGKYLHDVATELWPIYILIVFGSLTKVGFVFSFAFVVAVIFSIFSGWYVDHKKSRILFYISGLGLALGWILRMLAMKFSIFVAAEIIDKTAGGFYFPTYDSFFYSLSKRFSTFEFHVYQEFILSLLAIFIWIGIGALVYMSQIWSLLPVLGFVGAMLSVLMYSSYQYGNT